MKQLRNILTAIWCAIIIGANAFGLIVVLQAVGLSVFARSDMALPVLQMILLSGFGVLSLISTKFLWVILAVSVVSMLLGFGYEVLMQRVWRPASMLTGLVLIIPTYLLARWNTLSRQTEFNPVKEF
ncbi:hypothetical protein [Henriciella litoralis]|uniref:hypothetical protein n=1 Tax=Henriciella litoralis TaxID=568102 RepID=UPI0009FDF47D|nr:hypothetical protein [Henriciella litoralis]